MADADIETISLVLREALVYRLPPRPSNKGYRAADWGLDKPMWIGRLKIITKGALCRILLEDKDTGALFAEAPIRGDEVSTVVESVMDSSRYFVIRVENQGKHAFLGVGFQERGDAFDFNVALQDHIKQQRKETESSQPYVPKNDLQLKEGQTMKINFKLKKKHEGEEEEEEDEAAGKPKHRGAGAKPINLDQAVAALSIGGPGPFASSSTSSKAATSTPAQKQESKSANPFASGGDPFAPDASSTTSDSSSSKASNPFAADWGSFQ